MRNLVYPTSRGEELLNELCRFRSDVVLLLDSVTGNTTTNVPLDLSDSNSVKFYVELTGTGIIKMEVLESSGVDGLFIPNEREKYISVSKTFMMPCTSEYIKVRITTLSGTPIITVKGQGFSDVAVEESTPKYKDLGEIINATNIAAGAVATSESLYDLQWVRNLIISAKSSQQFDVQFLGLDTVGLGGSWATTLFPLNGPAGGVWIPLKMAAVLGYSGKFIIKNVSSSTATYANLKVQLLEV